MKPSVEEYVCASNMWNIMKEPLGKVCDQHIYEVVDTSHCRDNSYNTAYKCKICGLMTK